MDKKKVNKKNKNQGRKDARAFRSGVESGESISKWDKSDKRFPGAQLDKSNDWRWYAFNEQLLRDSASFSFTWPLGGKLNSGLAALDAGAVPGVMAFTTVPSFGRSVDGTSAINTAARNIYSYVRHANAGHTNYEATDLMLYLMAMDSVDSFIAFMRRIYGVINLYTYQNRYYPDALLRAMHVDPADMRKHISDFRAFINMFIVRVGSMCVPNSMSYTARHMWMYENIYVDSDTAKAQTYLYVPEGFYFYQLDSTGKGMLKYTPLSNEFEPMSFDDICNYALAMINPILTSEDMNIMSGDILKAFGADGVIVRGVIREEYQVLPQYNEEVMSQFENVTMMTPFVPDDGTDPGVHTTPNVYQIIQEGSGEAVEGYLFYNPAFQGADAVMFSNVNMDDRDLTSFNEVYTTDRLLNMHKNDITPADVMVASRLTNIMTYDEVDDLLICDTMGSDLCLYAVIWRYTDSGMDSSWALQPMTRLFTALPQYTQAIALTQSSGDTSWQDGVTPKTVAGRLVSDKQNVSLMQVVNVHAQSTVQAVQVFADMVCALSKFDWHPGVYPVSYRQLDNYNINVASNGGATVSLISGGNVDNVVVSNIIMDIDKYALIDGNGLRKMSEVALLSQFSVPQMGNFARKFD